MIFVLQFILPINVQGESIQERAEAAGAEKRGTKRLKAKRSPALTKDDDSPLPGKKMAKFESTATAVKVPDYANMQEADDESARVRTKRQGVIHATYPTSLC